MLQDLRNLEIGLTLDGNDQPLSADKIKVMQTATAKGAKKKNKKKRKVQKTKKNSKFEDLLKQMAEKRKQNKEDGRIARRERKRCRFDSSLLTIFFHLIIFLGINYISK